MVKIGVLGNYGHNNIGDEAILHGLLASIPENAQVTVFTESITKSSKEAYSERVTLRLFRRLYQRKFKNIPLIFFDIIKSVRSVDRLVIGGGGLLNDSYKFVTFYYFLIGLIVRLLGKKYSIVGISIGPITKKKSVFFSACFLKMADSVVVRDQHSLKFALKYVLESKKCPDMALAIPCAKTELSKLDFVAFNVIPYFKANTWFEQNEDKYQKYLLEMVSIIKFIANTGVKVKLFAVDLVFDQLAIDDVYSMLDETTKKNVEVTKMNSTHMLIDLLLSARLMVGCRLHSAVLSVLSYTPYISLAYQEKVFNFGKEIGNDKYCHWLNNLDAEKVCRQYSELYNNDVHASEFIRNRNQQIEKINNFFRK